MKKKKIPKVVFTDYGWPSLDIEREEFATIGAEVTLIDSIEPSSLFSGVRNADLIVNDKTSITSKILDAAPQCQGIIHPGVGVDTIDVDAATERGVIVANIVGYCTDEVADHALAFILCCARRLVHGNDQVKQGRWNWKGMMPIYPLRKATLGVIGFGRIGQSVVQKAKAFGMGCLVYDPLAPTNNISSFGVQSVDLAKLCTDSDFISIHCPVTKDTRHLIGERELRLMKRRTYIINTSRGAIIDEAALIKALESGWIRGAALDVLEQEPSDANNPLVACDNVILTAHYAFYSERAVRRIRDGVCDAGIRILTNRWPKWVADPQVKSNLRNKDRKD